MLVVKIELWSAVTGKITEIGRTYIANDGTGVRGRGNYAVKVARKDAVAEPYTGWHDIRASRDGHVEDYPRESYNVWRLVSRALRSAFPEEK